MIIGHIKSVANNKKAIVHFFIIKKIMFYGRVEIYSALDIIKCAVKVIGLIAIAPVCTKTLYKVVVKSIFAVLYLIACGCTVGFIRIGGIF
jgi:hypothetical protein